MTTTFAETLGTTSVDDFLRHTWGRTFAHLPGKAGRFHDVLSWNDVNGILQKQRLEPPRLRLVRKGEFAAKSSYLRYEGNRIPHVVPEKLSERLRDGYTLIIDAVDDMADGVLRLAEDFQRVLHESVQVNMYAGWREMQGFHRHCDTHDVIVLQVFGKKYWRVYEGGRPYPLKDDIAPNTNAPSKIVWEGTLEDGDVLYIPRGWWHEASGVGDVTLHLTFGIHQRTGFHMLHWLADQLRASTAFREDLHRFATAEEQAAQLANLRAQLLEAFDDDVLGRYFAHQNGRARGRGWPSLPWTVAADTLPPLSAEVSLAAPRALELVRTDDSIRFRANGREWQFGAASEPLLRALERGPSSIASLHQSANGALDEQTVQRFVVELAQQGLVNLRDDVTGERPA